ncbi:UV radiation resistance-associated protein [Cylas formicarius]|uniref:UV radiation resistance-associated protein n=1 Tax=Cylas formicarius TaxID=197179 RepID=UPI002958C90F|nr:UV radiation resistance-associated protein [Cylas formicarius]
MNFSVCEFSLGRQRCRQWVPLITQQLRLRHVYQILAFNLRGDVKGSGGFYFTLHRTSMSSPFYASAKASGRHPKWPEVVSDEANNSSAADVVVRVWRASKTGDDAVVLAWGVNFSGLAYLGNKIADLQPAYFRDDTVIFFMRGGYFTSHLYLRNDPTSKPTPPRLTKNLNLIDNGRGKLLYRRVATKNRAAETLPSYGSEKLRKLIELQAKIRERAADVREVKEKIKNCSQKSAADQAGELTGVRFASQLLTMNTLNKMLREKPTQSQRDEMTRVSKEIEVAKFKIRMLTQERDRKCAYLRKLRAMEEKMTEENEERSSDLMARYHTLSRDGEKLKEYKKSLLHHREVYEHISSQLHHRQAQLLRMLLAIYPIRQNADGKYTIHGVHLPNSDVLAECSDTGLSVALGFVTHTLVMCSIFLQVPLRYPMVHMGSMSIITDQTSPLFPDNERQFPLFTKGKEKVHFGYAVYLLNKNLAQFRWLTYLHTPDLRATLPNLLQFLQSGRYSRSDTPVLSSLENVAAADRSSLDKWVSLTSIGTSMSSSVNDPILESVRREIKSQNAALKAPHKRPKQGGRGLGEILAIPEAYLNRQISRDLFERFVSSRDFAPNAGVRDEGNVAIKIKEGTEEREETTDPMNVEQGTDTLDPSFNFATKSIDIHSGRQTNQRRRLSRSMGSYTDEESDDGLSKSLLGLGSDPAIYEPLGQCLESPPWGPLTERTDKLLLVTPFNLVKSKPTN